MKAEKSIDDMLVLTGGFGRFQWLLLAMMAYCMTTLGLQGLTMTFVSHEPAWKCSSSSVLCNSTKPVKLGMTHYESRCKMNTSDWLYDDSFTSIITEFDLYCDRYILKNTATSMVYLGWLLGAIIFGITSDLYGRKKTLMISIGVMSVAGVASSFAKVFWLFTVLKVFVGAGIGGAIICIFVLNTEYAGPQKRALTGIIVWNFWTIGLCLVALLAYLFKDWRHLNFSTSAPGFVLFFFCWFIPESARWYIVHDRKDDAENVLKRVAKMNKANYPTNVTLEDPKKGSKNSKSCGDILDLFGNFRMKIHTTVCLLVWFTCSMTYYGVSLSSGALGGSIYLVFFLTSIIAIPANFVAAYLINKFGRKKILMISLVAGALSMIGAALIPMGKIGYTGTRIALAMLAKFLITVAFDAAYLITYEIFPTTLRNAGMGITSASARIGSFSASYIIYLKRIHRILPFLIFGVISIICAVSCCVLPETNNTPTKETFVNIVYGTADEGEENKFSIQKQKEIQKYSVTAFSN